MGTDEPGTQASFGMTDLEEALQGPDGASVRAEALGRLDAALLRVETRLRAGLDPRHFAPTESIRGALVTARGLLAAAHR